MGSPINYNELKEIENNLCNSKNNIKKKNQIMIIILIIIIILIMYNLLHN